MILLSNSQGYSEREINRSKTSTDNLKQKTNKSRSQLDLEQLAELMLLNRTTWWNRLINLTMTFTIQDKMKSGTRLSFEIMRIKSISLLIPISISFKNSKKLERRINITKPTLKVKTLLRNSLKLNKRIMLKFSLFKTSWEMLRSSQTKNKKQRMKSLEDKIKSFWFSVRISII